MRSGRTIYAAPSESVSVADAKAYLRVDISDDDALIGNLIVAARQWMEEHTHRAVGTQTWDFTWDRFPAGNRPIEAPLSPLQSVTHLKYVDVDGVLQTLTTNDYRVIVDGDHGLVYPAYDTDWPDWRLDTPDAVRMRAVVGYATVPQLMKQGMLWLVAHMYEMREPVITAPNVHEVPMGVQRVINTYRVPIFA